MIKRFAAAMVIFGYFNAAWAADWPTYRADESRSGYTSEAFPNQVKLR